MSTGSLQQPEAPELFEWHNDLNRQDYSLVTYRVASILSMQETALGMAMEQSAATLNIAGYVAANDLVAHTIRIVSCESLGSTSERTVPSYYLDTEVYEQSAGGVSVYQVELAFPNRLLQAKPAQLMNVLVGELPRLGFLTQFQVVHSCLQIQEWKGPAFGIDGIRERFEVESGPILCRSSRPAVGLSMKQMARLHHDVLIGGFHAVKDDELQVFATDDVFREHVRTMVAAKNNASQITGEKKSYIANLICEPSELVSRWSIVQKEGADGVLVSPTIQGFGVLEQLSAEKKLPLLAHNSGADLLCRNMQWGISESVLADWYRHLGADWWVTPGAAGESLGVDEYAKKVIHAGAHHQEADNAPRPAMMPILQGGKKPENLSAYRDLVGNDDYMLIVASWVDRHEKGLASAAGLFRQVLDQ